MKKFYGSNSAQFHIRETSYGKSYPDNVYIVMRRTQRDGQGWYFNAKAAMEAAHWFAELSRELSGKREKAKTVTAKPVRAKTVAKKPKKPKSKPARIDPMDDGGPF